MPVNGFLVNNTVQKYNYESLENYNTPDFSTSSTYQVGDYVMYQGKLYKCTTAITTGGAWDSTKWSLAILSDDVADLKSDTDDLNEVNFKFGPNIFNLTFSNANISNGVYYPLTTGLKHAATEGYLRVEQNTDYCWSFAPTEKWVTLYVFGYDASKNYVGQLTSWYIGGGGARVSKSFNTGADVVYLRFLSYRENEPWENLVPTDIQLEAGTVATPYLPCGYKESAIEELQQSVEGLEQSTKILSPNLLTVSFVNGRFNDAGEYVPLSSGTTNAATPDGIQVESNTEYTLSFEPTEVLISGYVIEFDLQGNKIGDVRYNTNSVGTARVSINFTTSSSTKTLKFQFYREGVAWENLIPNNLQIEIGHVATAYYPAGEIDAVPVFQRKIDELTTGYLPAYYDGYLSGKIITIENLLKQTALNGDAFYFITDMHWDKNAQHSPEIIKRLNSQLRINKLFTGGDITSNGYSNDPGALLREVMNQKSEVYAISGNHEFLGDAGYAEIYYQQSALYGDNVVFGDKAKNYYYLDNREQKVRYIVLGAYGEAVGGAAQSLYLDNNQLTWLTQTALQVEAGWTIIILTHCIYASPYISGEWSAVQEQPQQDNSNFTNAIKNYMANGAGEIACIIEGHLHYDRIFMQEGMPPVVATTCDKYAPWVEGGVDREPWLSNRVLGTITEQAFDVVILDKTAKTVSFVRVGCPAANGINTDFGTDVEIRTVNYGS